jgi:hypothetical protein
MRKSAPDWARFDVLVRELGTLRLSATPSSDAASDVAVALDHQISAAAAAVDAVAGDPSDDERAIAAWELILQGRVLVQNLKSSLPPSTDSIRGSVKLRRRAIAALAAADALAFGELTRG